MRNPECKYVIRLERGDGANFRSHRTHVQRQFSYNLLTDSGWNIFTKLFEDEDELDIIGDWWVTATKGKSLKIQLFDSARSDSMILILIKNCSIPDKTKQNEKPITLLRHSSPHDPNHSYTKMKLNKKFRGATTAISVSSRQFRMFHIFVFAHKQSRIPCIFLKSEEIQLKRR